MSREFVVRARAAPTRPELFKGQQGKRAHVEILAHCLMNALYLAGQHRPDTIIHLVLESSADFPRTLTYDGSQIKDLGGFSELALLASIESSLMLGASLDRDQTIRSDQGVLIRSLGFDRLLRELSDAGRNLYILSRKGADIREAAAAEAPCYLMTDHVPMPRKTLKYMLRLGVQQVSLGPRELFASQCITILHNELDRRY